MALSPSGGIKLEVSSPKGLKPQIDENKSSYIETFLIRDIIFLKVIWEKDCIRIKSLVLFPIT